MKEYLYFSAGVAVGVMSSALFFKKKYEKIHKDMIDSELESIRKASKKYQKKEETIKEEPEEHHSVYQKKPDIMEYAKKLKEEGYKNYSNSEEKEVKAESKIEPRIFTIPPEIYGEIDEYIKHEFTYYSDDILADELDQPVEDVEGTVGYDWKDYLGTFEEDAVYIQNDIKKAYYAINVDERTFEDALVSEPHTVED